MQRDFYCVIHSEKNLFAQEAFFSGLEFQF
jgi:hypothetical protein